MATKTWQVNTLQRELADGYVNKVIYRVDGVDGDYSFRATGEVNFTKPSSLPSDFKAYDTLTESVCLTWVKDTLGSTEVTAIETEVENGVNVQKTPTTATGTPWA